MKRSLYQDLQIKKGNVYSYLEDNVKEWLINEALKLNRCDIGLVIASIVKDAYAEEKDEVSLEARVYE